MFVLTVLALLCLLSAAQAFQLPSTRCLVHKISSSSQSRAEPAPISRLFAIGDKERKITRSDEGEYFESEFDRKPLSERLPLAFGVLAVVSLPFIVGLIYLYTNK